MLNQNVKLFLDELKKSADTDVENFAKNFDEKKYELMLKIINVTPISQEEWDLINNKYRYEQDFAKAMMSTFAVNPNMKKDIVQSFLDGKLRGITQKNRVDFIETIIKHYSQISDFQLGQLYDFCHFETMQPIRFVSQAKVSGRPPQHTIDRLVKFELSVINKEQLPPIDYSSKIGCFAFVQDGPTLDYIMKNMPENYGDAERIATALINSPDISNETKDALFAIHGCVGEDLTMATPNIIDELYRSAIETAILPEPDHKMSVKELNQIHKAMEFVEHLIRFQLLPESMQIDLVERLIHSDTINKNRSQNHMIGLITSNTKSANVLHKIFTSAKSANDRDNVCWSRYVSKEDIKEQARLYCDKIRKKLSAGKGNEVSEKWVETVMGMIPKATLNKEEYATILKLETPSLIDALVMTRNTPDDVFEEAKKITEKKLKECPTKKWRSIQLKLCANQVLKEKGIMDDLPLETIGKMISNIATYYNVKGNLDMAHINIGPLENYPELIPEMKDIFLKIIDIAEYHPEVKTQKEFKQAIEKMANEKLTLEHLSTGMIPIPTMSNIRLMNVQSDIKNDFCVVLLSDTTKAYAQLQEFADKYAEFDAELKSRKIEKELEER